MSQTTADRAAAAEAASPRSPTGVPLDQVVLTGFMGSGKTTGGRRLARLLGWRFVDADQAIEAAAGVPIAQIFATRGEPWFRLLERDTIALLLETRGMVLALGGGAIETESTRQRLLSTPSLCMVHLEISLDTVLKRCEGSETVRPVLADRARLSVRYQDRLPLYRQAHINLVCDRMHPSEAAQWIAARLGMTPSDRFPVFTRDKSRPAQ